MGESRGQKRVSETGVPWVGECAAKSPTVGGWIFEFLVDGYILPVRGIIPEVVGKFCVAYEKESDDRRYFFIP
jgi:hypothetical protein